jgi:hypothetical protein
MVCVLFVSDFFEFYLKCETGARITGAFDFEENFPAAVSNTGASKIELNHLRAD